MKRYRVRYLESALDALRDAARYIAGEAGPDRAGVWLTAMMESVDHLEASPRASQLEGSLDGREFRSKLVLGHRVFFTIDDPRDSVWVLDVVHTARQTQLERYRVDAR